MSKRIIVLLVAAVALVFASTAIAAITIQQAPAGPGYQNLGPYPNTQSASGTACIGNGGTYYLTPHQVTDQNGNPVFDTNGNPVLVPKSGSPIRLTFGWGAHTISQMDGFFKNSHGSVAISGQDTFSDSWLNSADGSPFLTTQGIRWSALAPIKLQSPGPNPQYLDGYNSQYRGTLTIAPGSYTLTQTYVFDNPVQDGFAIYRKPLTSTCTFTVVA